MHSTQIQSHELTAHSGPFAFRLAEIQRWVALSVLLLLLSTTSILAIRRMGGALQSPPSVGLLGLTMGAAILLLGVTRVFWTWGFRYRFDSLMRWCPFVTLIVLALSLTFRSSTPVGMALPWIMVFVSEVAAFRWTRRTQASALAPTTDVVMDTAVARPTGELHTSDVLQQMTRIRDANGRERIAGTVRADLEPGQRSETLHIAFCPPFDQIPQVTVDQQQGTPAQLKLAQVLPYGMRIEIRTPRAQERSLSLILVFSAEGEASGM